MNTINNTPSDIMLTTIDNPYNPYLDWDKWLNWDLAHGYDCCGKVARIAPYFASMTDEQSEAYNAEAILDILALFPDGPYCIAQKQ